MRIQLLPLVFLLALVTLFSTKAITQPSAVEYRSPDNAFYKSYSVTKQYVTLKDSVKIAMDVYLPEKGPVRQNYPTVFVMTPYGRAYIAPTASVPVRFVTWIMGLGWHPEIDQYRYSASVKKLLQHGYAVAVADMRGTGVSYGVQMPLDPQIGKDGKELVDWLASQPFSNGDVGMMGLSYLGWAQYVVAAQKPEALRCIAPEVIFFESYSSSFRPGGILAERWLLSFSERLNLMNLNFSDFKKFYIPALPVIDEDGDGQLEDEWPQMDSTIFLANAEPRYKDKQVRTENYYWNATKEHLGNLRIIDLIGEDYQYFNSATPKSFGAYTYKDVAPGHYLPAIHEIGIPVLSIGRWHDGFVKGTLTLHASSQHLNSQHLLINPGFHIPNYSKKNRNFVGYQEEPIELVANSHLQFFDKYLKKLDNGLDAQDPVQIFVNHSGWRSEKLWPPASVISETYYLNDHKLNLEKMGDQIDTICVDTLQSSMYGKDNYNRWTMATGVPKSPMERTILDENVSFYDTQVLIDDVEVIGHPMVEFWITCNRKDADLFVYLEDVDSKGRSWYVSEGQLKASWHKEASLEQQLEIDMNIMPNLPWHGYTQEFEDENPFEGGTPILMRFDLQPVAWNFKKGHKIRISIAGMDKDNFEINEAYYKDQKLEGVEIYLHQNDQYPSKVIFPIAR